MNDYPPVTPYLDDEEELRRRMAEAAPPVATPPVSAAAPVSSPVTSPADGTSDLESRVATPYLHAQEHESTSAPPVTSTAPRPKWSEYAPAEPHGIGKLGRALGEMFTGGPQRDLGRRELAYKNATSEYEAPIRENLQVAQTSDANARVPLTKAQTEHTQAETEALKNPQPKPKEEEWSVVPGMTGPNGTILQQEKTSGSLRWAPGISGTQPLKGEKENDFEQYYKDWLKDNGYPDTSHNRLIARKDYAAAGQAPQHEPRQMAIGPDGTVIELKPGMKVPRGTKTVSGELTNKPTADEQKRADLVENLNENLDQLEDIVTRRPELFGKIAGRTTKLREWVGSNDEDVAALKGIEDRLGMVQQSSHGMRSAQHVAQSADSLLNGFKNGADAMKKAIQDARNSGKTFTNDVDKEQNRGSAGEGGQNGELKPPKEADPGMKWQHRGSGGQIEWRQVPK